MNSTKELRPSSKITVILPYPVDCTEYFNAIHFLEEILFENFENDWSMTKKPNNEVGRSPFHYKSTVVLSIACYSRDIDYKSLMDILKDWNHDNYGEIEIIKGIHREPFVFR